MRSARMHRLISLALLGAMVIASALVLSAEKKKTALNLTQIPDQKATIRNLALVVAQQKCENWAWAAGVEIALLKQGVQLRQNFRTDKVNGGAVCLDSAGSMESLAKQVEGDYVLGDGRKFRLAVHYTDSAPNSSDTIIVPIVSSQPYILYWRGHAYVAESAVWNEYVYPNGQKYMEIKELTLIDPYESGEKRRVKYDVQTNEASELGGIFQVVATQLGTANPWK
jgi:hypothetical protein